MNRRLLVTLTLSSLLSLSLAHAAPQAKASPNPPAQLCAIHGDLAAIVATHLPKGVTYQQMLDAADMALAKSDRSQLAISVNRANRHIITTVALHRDWTPAQARTSLEMACLRGEHAY